MNTSRFEVKEHCWIVVGMNTCIENYEVTVGPGPLGISLCILRNGSGAFVESFYQSQDPMTEIMSVVALGDRIMRIGELDTSNANLDAILFALSNEPRPMVVLFCRYLQHDLVPFQLFDHRWNCWIEKFLNEEKPETVSYPIDDLTNVIHNYKIATMVIDYLAAGVSRDGENIQSIALECIMFCIRQFESDDVPEQLRDSINQLISLQGRGDDELLNALCAANSFLFGTLQRCVLEPFQHSTFAPRAVAWLSESPPFYRATLSEVLSDRIVGICYFLFLCQLRR